MRKISDKELVDALSAGVKRSTDLLNTISDYQGGHITTEYMLTADIAREFIDRHYEVAVEFLNRRLLNIFTAKKGFKAKKALGSRRTDIVLLYNRLIPVALLEIKIGVRTLKKVQRDLDKLIKTITPLKDRFKDQVVAASVFQVHIKGNTKLQLENDFLNEKLRIEARLRKQLKRYALSNKKFTFKFKPLQKCDGIFERELEECDGGKSWGPHGHATFFYTIIIRQQITGGASGNARNQSFSNLKRNSNE